MEQIRHQEINEFMMITNCEDAGIAMEILSITNNLEVSQLGCDNSLFRVLRAPTVTWHANESETGKSSESWAGKTRSD